MENKNNVKIYSTSTCPFCVMAKNYFKKNKIDFTDINVGEDEAAAKEMIEKSGQMGVPVLDIEGEIVIGFNEVKIKKLLDIK